VTTVFENTQQEWTDIRSNQLSGSGRISSIRRNPPPTWLLDRFGANYCVNNSTLLTLPIHAACRLSDWCCADSWCCSQPINDPRFDV